MIKVFTPERIISLILFLIPLVGAAYTANQRLAQLETKVESLSQNLNSFARKDVVDLMDAHNREILNRILEEIKDLRKEIKRQN